MSELNNNEFENVTNNSSQKKKKEKKSNGVGKFFFTVLLGLSFGLCAALAFAGANSVIKRHEAKVAEESQSEEVIEKNDEGTEKAVEKNVEEVAPKAPEEEKVQYDFSLNKVNSGLSVQEVAKEAMPSIVAITNKSIQELRSFYSMEIQEYESESAGSGIIVGKNDKELLIVTNAHVVADADTLSVCFIDGEAYEAVVKGTDTDNDLAVIAVDLSNISGSTLDEVKIAKMGDSEKLEIGEQVVAIGNAMGYGQSVTTGIVSALNRTIDGSDDGQSFIQTDAAINPGNSGGALLNMEGEVVGINSAKLANTKIEGMGYAIPTSAADEIVDGLMNLATRTKVDPNEAGYLGIAGFSVTNEVAEAYNIPKGIYVSETTEGMAAEKAGIKQGDVIIKFDGMGMDSINKLKDRLNYYKAGETVDVVIARANDGTYEEKTVSVTLDSREGTELDESKEASEKPSDEDRQQEKQGEEDGQRSGEFNIGGSTFRYSVPDNFFNFFER